MFEIVRMMGASLLILGLGHVFTIIINSLTDLLIF